MSIKDKIIKSREQAEGQIGDKVEGDNLKNSEYDKLEELQDQILKLKESLLRQAADNENIIKRSQRQMQETKDYAIASFAEDMVEVFENFHRASSVESISDEGSISNMKEGLEMIKKMMGDSLAKYGIERIFPLNEEFSHEYHQAIKQVSDNSKPNNSILEVVQAGYKIKNRLIKPAIVCVNVINGSNT
ncbi:Protein GrpE [Candidatus Cyrtobacter comes]|uniref:Protein GrpE n=1 Tax=Candidatus Cyrtobacter comes TaxID=675776 RepID=A0ABU5L7W5_9RICK|nr:nucleotide exchange factor GrpE [Candidatus Cyrtobacter comes]MDZ5762210.1 Protein GrpE [Candidatus Cyrtobacter comes]